MADGDDFQRLAINIEARIAAFEKQMSKVAKTTDDTMRAVTNSVDKNMRTVERRTQEAGNRINATLRQSLGGLKGSLLTGGSNAANLLGLGAVTAGFGALGAEIVDTMGRAQNLNTRLRTLLGSEGEAAKAQEYLAATAQKLSVDYFALSDSYARLLPLVNSGVLSTTDARKILEGFSNVAAATGASTEQLGQALFGLSQGLSAGTLRAEELNQITEPLPGIMQALDRAFVKVTGSTDSVAGAFRRAVNDGEVTSSLLRTTLVTALGEYDGAAAAMSGNVTASLTRLRNEWDLVVTEMSKSLADPFSDVISGASSLVGWLGRVAQNYNALPDALKKGNIAFAAGVAAGEVTSGLPAGTTANEIRDRARATAAETSERIRLLGVRKQELENQKQTPETEREIGAILDERLALTKQLREAEAQFKPFDTQQQSMADAARELRKETDHNQPFPPEIPDRPHNAAGLPPLPKKGSLEYESTFGDAGGVIEDTKRTKESTKAKEQATAKLAEHIRMLQIEADRLSLSGVALKENELLTEAAAQAKEDFKNKLRSSAALTDTETAAIKANAKVLAGVPEILALAKDNLPEFALASQMKMLTEMQALISDPKVAEALEAQGLSAADASKAIGYAMDKARDSAYGTSEAIGAVGDAINSGIQSAQTFSEAIQKIGFNLLNLLAQGAFGQGPLGKIFNSILGVGAGGVFGLFGGGSAVSGSVNAANAAVALLPKHAGGGDMPAGRAGIINELGQEAARRGGDLFIPGKATRIIPADATRRMGGGFGSGRIDLNLNVSGIGDKELLARVTAAAAQASRQGIAEYDRKLLSRVNDQRARVG